MAASTGIQFLYLIASGNNDNTYKIGISNEPTRRLEQIKRQYNVPNAYIIETMDVSTRDEVFAIESALHEKYDRYAASHMEGREWFRLSQKQIDEIKAMYQHESNAFAQATAFMGLVDEAARLEPKALEMEADRQLKIKHNRIHGKRYNTKPVGYLKRYNDLQRDLNDGLLGIRFSLKTYPHSATDVLTKSVQQIKESAQSKVRHFWYGLGLTGLVAGLAFTGGDTAAGVITGLTGAVGGAITATKKPNDEAEEARKEIHSMLSQRYPGFDQQTVIAVRDIEENQSFLVKALDEDDSQIQLRNTPATRPRVVAPGLDKLKNQYFNRTLVPWSAGLVTSAILFQCVLGVSEERYQQNQSFLNLPVVAQVSNT